MLDLYVRRHPSSGEPTPYVSYHRWARSVPDPFLGPKGVRLLLVARGIFGSVLTLATQMLLLTEDASHPQVLRAIWHILFPAIPLPFGRHCLDVLDSIFNRYRRCCLPRREAFVKDNSRWMYADLFL